MRLLKVKDKEESLGSNKKSKQNSNIVHYERMTSHNRSQQRGDRVILKKDRKQIICQPSSPSKVRGTQRHSKIT